MALPTVSEVLSEVVENLHALADNLESEVKVKWSHSDQRVCTVFADAASAIRRNTERLAAALSVDRLVELGYLHEVAQQNDCAGQHRIFTWTGVGRE